MATSRIATGSSLALALASAPSRRLTTCPAPSTSGRLWRGFGLASRAAASRVARPLRSAMLLNLPVRSSSMMSATFFASDCTGVVHGSQPRERQRVPVPSSK